MLSKNQIILILVFLIPLYSGCINENHDCPSDGMDDGIKVNLTITTGALTTRADHNNETASDADNYINISDKDFAVYILEDGTYSQRFEPGAVSLRQGSASNTYDYIISGVFRPAKETEKVQFIVLVNCQNSFGGNYNYIDNNLANKDLDDVYADNEHFNFTYPIGAGNPTWKPAVGSTGIPMFGVSGEYLINAKDLNIEVSESIPMMRALAKVEIVDEMPSSTISSVTLSRIAQNGRIIVDGSSTSNPKWNDTSDWELKNSSLPKEVVYVDFEGESGLSFFKETKNINGVNKPVWSAYIPEMDLTASRRPQFTIYDGSTKLDPTPFTNYVDKKPVEDTSDKALKYVLRNHIYRYNVTIDDSGIEITSEVLPWDKKEVPAWNFENAKLVKYLSWKTQYTTEDSVDDDMIGKDNGYNDKSDELRLIMKPGVNDYAEGTFKLEAPVGARWYAELISLNQDHHDSFQFVGADGEPFKDSAGNVLNYATDIIDGTNSQTIRIKNLSEKVYEENNEARLVITIEYPDKTRKEVYVVDPATRGNNYTIVQEITEFV